MSVVPDKGFTYLKLENLIYTASQDGGWQNMTAARLLSWLSEQYQVLYNLESCIVCDELVANSYSSLQLQVQVPANNLSASDYKGI